MNNDDLSRLVPYLDRQTLLEAWCASKALRSAIPPTLLLAPLAKRVRKIRKGQYRLLSTTTCTRHHTNPPLVHEWFDGTGYILFLLPSTYPESYRIFICPPTTTDWIFEFAWDQNLRGSELCGWSFALYHLGVVVLSGSSVQPDSIFFAPASAFTQFSHRRQVNIALTTWYIPTNTTHSENGGFVLKTPRLLNTTNLCPTRGPKVEEALVQLDALVNLWIKDLNVRNNNPPRMDPKTKFSALWPLTDMNPLHEGGDDGYKEKIMERVLSMSQFRSAVNTHVEKTKRLVCFAGTLSKPSSDGSPVCCLALYVPSLSKGWNSEPTSLCLNTTHYRAKLHFILSAQKPLCSKSLIFGYLDLLEHPASISMHRYMNNHDEPTYRMVYQNRLGDKLNYITDVFGRNVDPLPSSPSSAAPMASVRGSGLLKMWTEAISLADSAFSNELKDHTPTIRGALAWPLLSYRQYYTDMPPIRRGQVSIV
jgi:hypothetical protein